MQILFFTMPIFGTPQLDLAPPRGDDDDIDRAIGGRRRRPQHLPFNTSVPLLLKLFVYFIYSSDSYMLPLPLPPLPHPA